MSIFNRSIVSCLDSFYAMSTMKNFDGSTVNDNFMYMYFDSVKE